MCDWRLSHLTNFWEDRSWSRTPAVSEVGKSFLIQHVVNVKTLNGSEHDGRSFKRWYEFYAFTNQFLTTVCSTFNPTCDAQMRTGIHLLNVVWLTYDHFLAHLAFRPCELLSSLFVRRLSSVVRRTSSVRQHFTF
jgi:hypothetical protein